MLRNMASIYILHDNKILMLYRIGSRVVAPSWCGIGGHFEESELNNAEACAVRELFEETGITEKDITNLRLRYITLRLKNGEVRQNYYFFAQFAHEPRKEYSCTEGILEWVDIDKVLSREMPFSAKPCLEHFLSIGKYNQTLYAGSATEHGIDFVELLEF